MFHSGYSYTICFCSPSQRDVFVIECNRDIASFEMRNQNFNWVHLNKIVAYLHKLLRAITAPIEVSWLKLESIEKVPIIRDFKGYSTLFLVHNFEKTNPVSFRKKNVRIELASDYSRKNAVDAILHFPLNHSGDFEWCRWGVLHRNPGQCHNILQENWNKAKKKKQMQFETGLFWG